jgi:cytochrome c553
MKEVGTQAKYDEIMKAIGGQLSEDQRNALSKFIKK